MGYFNRENKGTSGGRRSFGSNRSYGGKRSFGGNRGGDRQMYDAICDNCGKPCQLPFRPTGEKPVYCKDCFAKMGRGEKSLTEITLKDQHLRNLTLHEKQLHQK